MSQDQLKSDDSDKDVPLKERLIYLWYEYVREHKWLILLTSIIGSIAAVAGGFGLPTLLNTVFPIVFGKAELPEVYQSYLISWFGVENLGAITLWLCASLFPVLVIIRGVSVFINAYILTKVGMFILEKLRLKLYRCYQSLSLAFHDKQKRGDLISRLMGDTAMLQDGMVSVANDIILQPLTLLAALGYLVSRSFESEQFFILLLNMLLVGACVIPIQKIGKKLLNRARKQQAQMGDLTSTIQENLSSQRDIRAFELEGQQVGLFKQKIRSFLDITLSVIRWRSILTPLIEVVSAIAIAVTLYIGARNNMTLADFVSLVTAMYLCYEPMKKLGNMQNRIKIIMAGFERIEEILTTADDVPEPSHARTLAQWKGNIEYKDVSFSYDGEHEIMKGINLSIPAGQVVALVGPSGSGKTTFINLLCRFYDVDRGSVTIDQVNVKEFAKRDLMDHIALVSQFPVLFRGTVLDNILIGKPSSSNEEAIEAAHKASVDSFINDHPEAYQRMIGEMGEGLSGGQRQRVSIARAFLKDAPILILDEATASLDMKSEELIQKEIEGLAQGRTTFIIAHRFSTIRMADRILVLEKGRIVGDGTHEELMEMSPLYKDLYERQVVPANEAEIV